LDTLKENSIETIRLLDKKEVSFDEVLKKYHQDHGTKHDLWEVNNLKRAHKRFGKWVHAKIPVEDIGGIVLPYHVGACDIHSDLPQKIVLVPPTGLTLSDTHKRFKRIQDQFSKLAPACHEKIWQAKQLEPDKLGSFFFSQEPLLIGSTYKGLTGFRGQVTHLDGLHRLMALLERKDRPNYLDCYVSLKS
jgi:hypothetical protein